MIADRETVENAWLEFQAKGIRPPTSEAEYQDLHRFMDELTSRHDVEQEPWSSLFGLVAGYMLEWERQHHEPLEEATPAEVLASLMEEHGVSQYQLEKEGIADQSLLSKILSGKRGISKALAKRLGERFKIEPSVFL